MKARIKVQTSAKGATINKWFKIGDEVEVIQELPDRLVLVKDKEESYIIPVCCIEMKE